LGRIIREIKAMSQIPVAVLTNGALLYLPEVRRELAARMWSCLLTRL
jgi:wyosine [tRNA(Phe)-imidazoG37] synthetase (radical SAM superfamily)